ncbi:MAG: OsmC family peroxiredoxin [Planctomycetota bacterium]|nr:MAG: OsmC family peroxiredoxin [Planctomycetota bacterium]
MVRIDIRYAGDLRCEAHHAPSGASVLTDAPMDNHGKGECFSPTDLVAAALGSCMATLMGIVAARHKLNLDDMRVTVTKEMRSEPVRRIGRLSVEIQVPAEPDARLRAALEAAALACPVHASLHPDIELPVSFRWGQT